MGSTVRAADEALHFQVMDSHGLVPIGWQTFNGFGKVEGTAVKVIVGPRGIRGGRKRRNEV